MDHIMTLLSNPWIMIPLFIFFAGEYIPFTKQIWEKIGIKFKSFGEWFLEKYENRLYSKKEEWQEEKKIQLKFNNIFARILFFALSAFVLIFLEIFWEFGFKGITRSLERSRLAIWSEEKIKTLPNWIVLALFGAPFIFMELIGVFALMALVSGHVWVGIGLYLFKVLFFIPVHFVLHVGEDQLMAIPWFKRRYEMVMEILKWFKRSQTYVKVHNVSETIKAYILAFKDRFAHTILLLKKAFEHDDILSLECEEVRLEVLSSPLDSKEREALYKKFFDCVNGHMKNSDKSNNSKE